MGREGVAALFDRLYAEHARGVHAFFLGRTGDPAVADELLQEAFLRAWQRLADVQAIPEERQRYWLYRVARNLLTDHYRRRAARPEVGPLDMSAAPESGLPSAQALDLEAAIAHLPEELRAVLAMRYAGGLTSAEIGEALGCPAGTVRYRLAEARQRLAEMLGDGRLHGEAAYVEEEALVHDQH
ncbi:MAG: sigma-70 family RNA polymerase sigma factor [Anaerolineae bacterium]|nr:sigma-70 family RNA polymerase sigma factor [Anaerolineae bacterium]